MRPRALSLSVIAISIVAALNSASRTARSLMMSPDAIQDAAYTWTEAQEAVRWAAGTLAGLSLEKKIGQMICPDITAGYVSDDDPRLAGWLRQARDLGVGMFVLYGGTPRDAAHLLNALQKDASIHPMAADFEGGPGQQVTGAIEFPANMAFAAAGSEDLVYRAASAAAVEGRAMGIHLTYTPVVDIAVRPDNLVRASGSWRRHESAGTDGASLRPRLSRRRHADDGQALPGTGDVTVTQADFTRSTACGGL
jgi:hypothetical protein